MRQWHRPWNDKISGVLGRWAGCISSTDWGCCVKVSTLALEGSHKFAAWFRRWSHTHMKDLKFLAQNSAAWPWQYSMLWFWTLGVDLNLVTSRTITCIQSGARGSSTTPGNNDSEHLSGRKSGLQGSNFSVLVMMAQNLKVPMWGWVLGQLQCRWQWQFRAMT